MSKLSQNRDTSPLFDSRRFYRHLKAAYTEMLERQRRSEPPQGFTAGIDY
jgi:protein O-GlcNAc transferase